MNQSSLAGLTQMEQLLLLLLVVLAVVKVQETLGNAQPAGAVIRWYMSCCDDVNCVCG